MKRKIKNAILRTITVIASAMLILSAGCADTPDTNAPFIIAVASLTWLSLFAYANSAYRRAKR